MFGKLISEETERSVSTAARVAALSKSLESITAAMKNVQEASALHSELATSADELNKKMKELITQL